MEKICVKCKQVRSPEDFFSAGWKNGKQYFRRTCNYCYRAIKKSRVDNLKEWYTNYKKSLYCIKCGQNDYRVLDFDHILGNKVSNVGSMCGYSKENRIKEIAKCQVLCGNCHRIKTLEDTKRIDYKKSIASKNKEIRDNLRKCKLCAEYKDIEEFAKCHRKDINGLDYRRWVCNKCYINKKQIEKRRKVDWLDEYKKTQKCAKCGVEDYRVLEFDHIEGNKDFNLANGKWNYGVEKLKEEIAKCQVLCVNCHRIKTLEENNLGVG